MPLAQLLLAITGGGSILLFVALTAVVARRSVHEKRVRFETQRAAAFRKAVLPLIGRRDVDAVAALEAWRGDPGALEVAKHLLQLLRGGERERLLDLVQTLDLLDIDRELQRLNSSSPARRIATVRKLGSFPAPRVEDALQTRLRTDPHSTIRLEAGLALVRLGTLPPVADAIEALDKGAYGAPAHRIIFRALASYRPAEMVAAWRTHGHGPARLAIADALGDVFAPGAFAALREAILDPDPQMRCEGLRSARKLGHPSMASAVLAALNDPEWTVRVQAASSAGGMKLEQARPQLEAMLQDAQWWVRYRAGEALAAMRVASGTGSSAA
ncbi:HEAT repeat domain-containing protein [Sphingomonas sp. PB2P12]|uniref:HEAT repeat domain-containing protein n=1 Tax=Sphingomonas sandaracina TaxID=3096157 RepID=UPI002FCC7FA5